MGRHCDEQCPPLTCVRSRIVAHWVSATYLDVQEARASAALPAAGALDANPTEMVCAGFDRVHLSMIYTPGAAGGGAAFAIQIWVSPYLVAADVPAGAEEWVHLAAYDQAIVAAGTPTVSLVQSNSIQYGDEAIAGAAETIHLGTIPIGAMRLRIPAQETGLVLTPGTLQIQARFTED